VRVAIDHVTIDRALDGRIVSAFAPLRDAGYDFRYAPDGTPYQIMITRLFTLACDSGYIGYWHRASQQIAIAPQCLETEAQLRHVVAHELAHAIGGLHVCHDPSEVIERRRVGDDCHGTAFGPALLNPFTDYAGAVSPSELTNLDFAELRRVGAIR